MDIHIVLVEPEIPPNTGNIARSCAATGAKLHLIEPLGFSIDDRTLKRAGLDYWPFVKLEVHKNLQAFMDKYGGAPMYFATTKGAQRYTDVAFEHHAMILFGKETAGLPEDLLARHQERTIRIPMSGDVRLRSLNLSNSVSIVLFEALRQQDFPDLV